MSFKKPTYTQNLAKSLTFAVPTPYRSCRHVNVNGGLDVYNVVSNVGTWRIYKWANDKHKHKQFGMVIGIEYNIIL